MDGKTKIHAVCASEKFAFKNQLSAENRHSEQEGIKLIKTLGFKAKSHLLIDRACEDSDIRALAIKRGLIPVIPLKKNRKTPEKYDSDCEFYKGRNKVEQFILRLKRFRNVFTR